jgi:hypothetical protein
MSVLSTLALLVAAASARIKPKPDKTDPRFLAGYDAGLKDGRLEIAELKADIATLNAQARRDQELIDLWRERALAAMGINPFYSQQALAQQALAQQAMAMENCYNQQALALRVCTCVPARHDMFMARE